MVSAGDIIDKTLIAAKRIPVYRQAADGAEIVGYVDAGKPVGVVYSYLNPNPALNRSGLWWAFYPNSGMYYYAPHNSADFSLSALKQQGVISTTEKVKEEQDAAKRASRTWYENLISDYWYIPVGIGALIAAPGIITAIKSKR